MNLSAAVNCGTKVQAFIRECNCTKTVFRVKGGFFNNHVWKPNSGVEASRVASRILRKIPKGLGLMKMTKESALSLGIVTQSELKIDKIQSGVALTRTYSQADSRT